MIKKIDDKARGRFIVFCPIDAENRNDSPADGLIGQSAGIFLRIIPGGGNRETPGSNQDSGKTKDGGRFSDGRIAAASDKFRSGSHPDCFL